MRTRRGKRRHPGRAATLRGAERHPKPGATPGLRVRKLRASRFGTRPARVASGSGRGRPALEGLRATSKARGANLRGGWQGRAAVERLCGGHRSEHSPPGRPGARRPPGKHRSARDARCATTKRSTPGVRTRGHRFRVSPGCAGHGSFPPPPCSSRTPRPFPGEGWRRLPPFRGARCLTGSAASLSPVPQLYAKGGRLPLPPLMVMRQSRRKKRPPLAPKDPA